MATTNDFRRFLAWTGGVTAAGALACAALVVLVDPYRLYGVLDKPGFNQRKTQPQRYQKEIKLAGARAAGANLFIIGNSRAEIGLDPADPALAATGLSPYNLALAGTRVQVAREQLEQLASMGQHPRHLIVGAEFLDFPVAPDAIQAPVPPTRMPGLLADLPWKFDTLFSVDSVIDALKTVRAQRAGEAPTMTALGFNPLAEYKALARDEGYYALFQQRAGDYAKRFGKLPRSLTTSASGSSNDWRQLEAVLEQGARGDARIDVVIYPYHAQILALMDAAGMGPMFAQWKAGVAAQAEALRRKHPQARVTVWDFSGYGSYQCEPIPAKGDRKAVTRWYWEAGHFKAPLGHLMLERMLGGAAAAPDFGFVLTPATLAENAARVARERAACEAAYPELFTSSAALVARR